MTGHTLADCGVQGDTTVYLVPGPAPGFEGLALDATCTRTPACGAHGEPVRLQLGHCALDVGMDTENVLQCAECGTTLTTSAAVFSDCSWRVRGRTADGALVELSGDCTPGSFAAPCGMNLAWRALRLWALPRAVPLPVPLPLPAVDEAPPTPVAPADPAADPAAGCGLLFMPLVMADEVTAAGVVLTATETPATAVPFEVDASCTADGVD